MCWNSAKAEDIIQTMSIGQAQPVHRRTEGQRLRHGLDVRGGTAKPFRLPDGYLRADGHRRLALLPQGAGQDGLHIGVGIGLCFTYILVCKFAAEFAKSSTFFSPILLVWLPDIFYAFIALYLYKKAPK